MGRQPCCDKIGLNKGPWTADEDLKLVTFIAAHGHGCWREVPKLAGLLRCGKSCRLRWTNYLRPDLKRGMFSEAEETLIIRLHAALGNRWSRIAAHLPGRTDNEIKNYWNTRIKKKLRQLGIDPVTHRPMAAAPPQAYHLCNELSSAPVSMLGSRNQFQAETIHSEHAEHTTNEAFDGVKVERDAEMHVGWSTDPIFEPERLGAEKAFRAISFQTHVSKSLLLQDIKPNTSAKSSDSVTSSQSSMSSPTRKTRSNEDSDGSVCTREFVDARPDLSPQQLLPCYQQNNFSATMFDANFGAIYPSGRGSGDLKLMPAENFTCSQSLSPKIASPLPCALDNPNRELLPQPEICPFSSDPLASLSSITVEASTTGTFMEFSKPSTDLCSTAEYPTQWNDLADAWNSLDHASMVPLYESANPAAAVEQSTTPGSWTGQLSDCLWSEPSSLL